MANVFQTLQMLLNRQQYAQLVALVNANKQLLSHPDICHMYGYALRNSGAIADALSFYRKAAKQFPKHLGILVGAANLLGAQEQYKDAIRLLEKAIKVAPEHYDAVYNLARLMVQTENISSASKLYEKATKINPSSAAAKVGLASCIAKLEQPEKAARLYASALNIAPDYVPALNNYAGLKRSQGENEQAISLYQRAVNHAPNNSELHRNLAAMYNLVGKVEDAKHHYVNALSLTPTHAELHIEYVRFNWSHQFPMPFAAIEQAIQTYPSNAELRLAYVNLLLKNDDGNGAVKVLENVLKQFPDDNNLIALASTAERQRGNIEQALQLSSKLFERKQQLEHAEMVIEHGYNLLATGGYQQALPLFREIVKQKPDDQGHWTLLATGLREAGEHDEHERLVNYMQTISSCLDTDQQRAGRLKTVLLDLHNTSQHPIDQSLRNGTQTLENIFVAPNQELVDLKQWMTEKTQAFLQSLTPVKGHPFLQHVGRSFYFNNAWSVNLFENGFHKSHFHPQGWLSGVYYVDVPECVNTDGQGWITFGKAEIPNLDHKFDFAVKPQKGLFVLFPSFLWHGTRPFMAQSNRMTVVVDILPNLN